MKSICKSLFVIILLSASFAFAQNAQTLSEQMADTAMDRVYMDSPNGVGIPPKWVYDFGTELNGIKNLWFATGKNKYFDFIKKGVDTFVQGDGSIKTYKVEEYNIDMVNMGRSVLLLFRVTGEAKYKKAADLIRLQLKNHPRTNEGGFWHKKIYPYQMWLDGLYMGEPFYAEYSQIFNEPQYFDDIANQFIWMEKHVRDEKTGLLYHAWDESKKMDWADKTTGRAPMFWGRALGWYAMAIVDTLDYFPKDHPKRAELIRILNGEMAALEKVQDKSGTWWLIVDKPNEKGNYLEASSSAMFVYAMAKGVRMGYLPETFMDSASKGWTGINKEFISNANGGKITLEKTIGGAGLGGNPYRAGDYAYYISEKIVQNDPKGVGSYIKAATEMELMKRPQVGKGKTVLLDSFFNNEIRRDDSGKMVSWHYKWDEMSNGGYSLWGKIFESYGAKLATLKAPPTTANLKDASVYIIVDPDTEKEADKPDFVQAEHIKAIKNYVESGGVLVLLGNDFGNAEFDNFNNLAKEFGVEFNSDNKNLVQNNQFEQGKVTVPANNEIFKTANKLYLKEISSLKLSGPAESILDWNGDKIMAVSKFGKGTVFALGDPWLYNEYVDGRKLPADFQNFNAANDLGEWLLKLANAVSQNRQPSEPIRSFIVKTNQTVSDLKKSLNGENKALDLIGGEGMQLRVAIQHDERKDSALAEVHDASDDVYYVLEGSAELTLGGKLENPREATPGEWKSEKIINGKTFTIKKGDLIVVPRGTPHQRINSKGETFSLILIKIFADPLPLAK
jgi:unsaturated rhamnogalacturonyl hydrolase